MKKKLLFVFVCVQLLACNKFDFDDLWHQHNPDCRIEEIAYHPDYDPHPDTIFAKFSYDHKGNPTKIISSFVATGRPSHFFRYDKKGRLVDYLGLNSENSSGYHFWYHYKYDQNGRIIEDSSHLFGNMINGQPQPDGGSSSKGNYEYDAYDRVKKVTRLYSFGVETNEYIYNQAGNLAIHNQYFDSHLARSDTFHYDLKVNLHRTNKLWMFLNRNYSRNNPKPATLYNKSGLSLQYRLPVNNDFNFLISIELSHSDIRYRCK
jgi:hypothetical protein